MFSDTRIIPSEPGGNESIQHRADLFFTACAVDPDNWGADLEARLTVYILGGCSLFFVSISAALQGIAGQHAQKNRRERILRGVK